MIVDGEVLAIARANIDTDQIIPARYLTGLEHRGYGPHLLEGMPDGPALLASRPGAVILVTGANLGCGSSREHAAWALLERGFRAVVAPSFARIFEDNCYTNGVVPIRIAEIDVPRFAAAQRAHVDVAAQTIALDGGAPEAFPLDVTRKAFVLGGGVLPFLAARIPAIRAWEAAR